MAHKRERGASTKLRWAELFSLYRYSVTKRTGVTYTLESTTPDVARDATICWWKGTKHIRVTDPRLCNSSATRVRPILSIVLLMLCFEDPAFLAILRDFKGGAVVEETVTARSVTPATGNARKAQKRKASKSLSDRGETDEGDDADDDGGGRLGDDDQECCQDGGSDAGRQHKAGGSGAAETCDPAAGNVGPRAGGAADGRGGTAAAGGLRRATAAGGGGGAGGLGGGGGAGADGRRGGAGAAGGGGVAGSAGACGGAGAAGGRGVPTRLAVVGVQARLRPVVCEAPQRLPLEQGGPLKQHMTWLPFSSRPPFLWTAPLWARQ